jgi:hypothetical protein
MLLKVLGTTSGAGGRDANTPLPGTAAAEALEALLVLPEVLPAPAVPALVLPVALAA